MLSVHRRHLALQTNLNRPAIPLALLAGLLFALCACVAAPSLESPNDYLDEATGATVSVVGKPIVFAHERRELAANTRDYITMAAGSVNRAGKINYVLIAYFWSTVDARNAPGSAPVLDPLTIAADDRRIVLRLEGHSAQEAGIGIPVHAPPGRDALPNVYRTDLGTLRFISEARSLAVVADLPGASPVSYDVWEDQRAALKALVALLSGQR